MPGLVLGPRAPRRRAGALSLLLALLASLLLVTAPAQANAERFTEQIITVDCGFISDPGGGTLLLNLFLTDVGGGFADVVWWPAGTAPETDPPLLIPETGTPTFTFDGASLSVTVALVVLDDPDHIPADATIEATVTPNGDPIPIDVVEEPGRGVHIRRVGTSQAILVSGTVTLPTGEPAETVEFADCTGVVETVSVFATFPDAFVTNFSQVTLICELNSGEDFLFLGADSFNGVETFVSLFFLPADMTASSISGFTESFSDPIVRLDAEGFSASIPLFEDATGNPVGTAVASASFTPSGAPTHYVLDAMSARVRVTEQPMAVSGALDMPGALPDFDLAGCRAAVVEEKIIDPTPSGPKPRGAAPVNDLPSGAISLAPGDALRNVSTAGAAEAAEAPCQATFEGEVFEVAPFGHTVWYTVEGTGAPVTIDTAGTSFDTVIGVYAGAELSPVTCVDDVFLGITFEARTLQAAVTFETVPGETYYVQIGGFGLPEFGQPFEFGRLALSVS